MKNKLKIIDLSIPRRMYFDDECSLGICPECASILIEEGCTILLCVESNSDNGEFMTSLSGSSFCKNCPVVVFDKDVVEQAVRIGIRGNKNIRYFIAGIVDLESIPNSKKHLEIGTDENPVPMVEFLPDLKNKTSIADKKPARNGTCSCGSGKKYKRCCGK